MIRQIEYTHPGQAHIDLDPKEIAWLAAHPKIRIGADPDYAPYSFVDDNGQFSGVSTDFVQILNERLGINMTMVPGLTWQDILDGAQQGSIDVIAPARKTSEREKYLNFSQTYIPTPLVIITRNDNFRIKSRYDIEGEKIALVRGYASHEQIAKEFPGIETFWYAKPLYALRAVSTGRADAYVGSQGTSSYLISKHAMTNLKVAAIYDDSADGQRFAVRKDWPELAGILDKALDSIPPGDRFKMISKWITLGLDPAQQKKIVLTKAEKQWLAGKGNIRLGVDPAWPPFEFFDATKTYAGIASDYVQLLNKRLNIKMTPVAGLSWTEVMEKTRVGDIDVLPCVVKTPARSQYLLFSRPYLSFPMVILTREDAPYISGVMDFKSEKIAIVQGYVTQEILARNYPDRKFYLAKNVDEALRAVSRGKVEAFVGNLASISYATQKLGLTNLKVATTTPYKYELSFAVRKDWPELINILNKMLETISDSDSSAIHNRWINVRFERQFDWMLVFKIVIPIILVGGLVLFFFVRWNRTLTREVTERKKFEAALVESRASARGLLDATQESLLLLDRKGNVLAVNQTAADRLGQEPEDLVGTNRFDLLPAGVQERRKEIFSKVLQTGTPADFEDDRDGIVFRSRYYPFAHVAGIDDEGRGIGQLGQEIGHGRCQLNDQRHIIDGFHAAERVRFSRQHFRDPDHVAKIGGCRGRIRRGACGALPAGFNRARGKRAAVGEGQIGVQRERIDVAAEAELPAGGEVWLDAQVSRLADQAAKQQPDKAVGPTLRGGGIDIRELRVAAALHQRLVAIQAIQGGSEQLHAAPELTQRGRSSLDARGLANDDKGGCARGAHDDGDLLHELLQGVVQADQVEERELSDRRSG